MVNLGHIDFSTLFRFLNTNSLNDENLRLMLAGFRQIIDLHDLNLSVVVVGLGHGVAHDAGDVEALGVAGLGGLRNLGWAPVPLERGPQAVGDLVGAVEVLVVDVDDLEGVLLAGGEGEHLVAGPQEDLGNNLLGSSFLEENAILNSLESPFNY